MKYFIVVVLTLTFFYGCAGSGKITIDELLRNPSFNSNDFFNGKISIYSPYEVLFPSQKYPDITEAEFKDFMLNKFKEKLSGVTNNENIKIENRTAPDFFRGIKLKPGEGEQLLRSSKSDYLLIIQSVIIGNESTIKPQKIDSNPVPPGIKDAKVPQNTPLDKKFAVKNKTQTSIIYDIWDVKKGVSVLSLEASIVLVDGINHKDPYLSIEKVTEALINHIKGEEE